MKKIIIFFFTMSLLSCSKYIMETSPEEIVNDVMCSSLLLQTKSTLTESADSLSLKIYRQTDPIMRLLDQILLVDGVYRSAMTKEEAMTVGIPGEVYDKIELVIYEMNARLQ